MPKRPPTPAPMAAPFPASPPMAPPTAPSAPPPKAPRKRPPWGAWGCVSYDRGVGGRAPRGTRAVAAALLARPAVALPLVGLFLLRRLPPSGIDVGLGPRGKGNGEDHGDAQQEPQLLSPLRHGPERHPDKHARHHVRSCSRVLR